MQRLHVLMELEALNAAVHTVATPSILPLQTLDQTYIPTNYPFLAQQTCSSGPVFCAATVMVPRLRNTDQSL